MKKILILILVTLIIGCASVEKRKYTVYTCSDSKLQRTQVDSVEVKSKNHVVVWIDGKEITIISDRIGVQSN